MIKAFKANYIKFDQEESKRKGHYLVLEMTIKNLGHIQLMIISQDGLVYAGTLDTITEITGYHRYMDKKGLGLGAGELSPLNTKDDNGMLEGLSKQLGFNYTSLATAFGKGLLQSTETD